MAFTLKYPTNCYSCGMPMARGTQAVYFGKDDGCAHAVCPPKPKICDKCFVEIPHNGKCDNCE